MFHSTFIPIRFSSQKSVAALLSMLLWMAVLIEPTLAASHAASSTTPGSVSSPYPTFHYLSIDWPIAGDDNRNATVDVRYRPVGTSTWNDSMGLRRISAGSNAGFPWNNKLSGSLFDLQPGTNYDIELTLNDPDGGSTVQTIQQATRALPDFSSAIVTEIPAGAFGTLTPLSGTAAQPRLYRSADPNNRAQFSQINLTGKEHVYVQNVTVNAPGSTAVLADSANNIGILNSTLNAQFGIVARGSGGRTGVTNGYFADNFITGESVWAESSLGVSGNNVGEGIQITGPGNVIAYNKVSGFRDAISLFEGVGNVIDQVSIDIYGNDISVGVDDGIEADFCQGNCRIIGNRITDSFIGISSQPSLGGPNYIMRNVMYNIAYTALKLHRFSEGDVVIHNTIVKAGSGMTNFTGDDFKNALFRNNLAIGGGNPGNLNGWNPGNGRPVDIWGSTESDFDYDAVGSTDAAPFSGRISIDGTFVNFQLVENNEVLITGLSPGDLGPLFPGVSLPLTKAEILSPHTPPDLRPGAGSAPVDQALLIPGINDDFLGAGPDMGAYEAGQPLPQYGPRLQVVLGDYNGDGIIDADDLAVWATDFSNSVASPGSGADGNGNGTVDGDDFLIWQRNLEPGGNNLAATQTTIPRTDLACSAGDGSPDNRVPFD